MLNFNRFFHEKYEVNRSISYVESPVICNFVKIWRIIYGQNDRNNQWILILPVGVKRERCMHINFYILINTKVKTQFLFVTTTSFKNKKKLTVIKLCYYINFAVPSFNNQFEETKKVNKPPNKFLKKKRKLSLETETCNSLKEKRTTC